MVVQYFIAAGVTAASLYIGIEGGGDANQKVTSERVRFEKSRQ